MKNISSYINKTNIPQYSTLPASNDGIGDYIIWHRTSNKWCMKWDYTDSVWVPIYSDGDSTVYVDATGTNAQGYGDGTGVDAFADWRYAWYNTPPEGTGILYIVIASGTFDHTGTYYWTSYKTIRTQIQGTYTVDLSGTVSAHTTGHAGTITHTGGGLTTNAHSRKIIRFTSVVNTSVSNYVTPIRSNTTTAFTLELSPTCTNGVTTYNICSPGTILDSSTGTAVAFFHSPYVEFYYIKIKNFRLQTTSVDAGYDDIATTPSSWDPTTPARINNVYLGVSGCFAENSNAIYAIYIGQGYVSIYHNVFHAANYSSVRFIAAEHFAQAVSVNNNHITQTSGTKIGIAMNIVNSMFQTANNYINNFNIGINVSGAGLCLSNPNTITNCTTGIQIAENSLGYNISNIYSGNTANTATATSGVIV